MKIFLATMIIFLLIIVLSVSACDGIIPAPTPTVEAPGYNPPPIVIVPYGISPAGATGTLLMSKGDGTVRYSTATAGNLGSSTGTGSFVLSNNPTLSGAILNGTTSVAITASQISVSPPASTSYLKYINSSAGWAAQDVSIGLVGNEQSITQNSFTSLAWTMATTARVWDTLGNQWSAQWPGRITVQESGKYLLMITLQGGFATNKEVEMELFKNGTAFVPYIRLTRQSGSSSGDWGESLSIVLQLNQGEYLEVFILHQDTTARNILPIKFSMTKLF